MDDINDGDSIILQTAGLEFDVHTFIFILDLNFFLIIFLKRKKKKEEDSQKYFT